MDKLFISYLCNEYHRADILSSVTTIEYLGYNTRVIPIDDGIEIAFWYGKKFLYSLYLFYSFYVTIDVIRALGYVKDPIDKRIRYG